MEQTHGCLDVGELWTQIPSAPGAGLPHGLSNPGDQDDQDDQDRMIRMIRMTDGATYS